MGYLKTFPLEMGGQMGKRVRAQWGAVAREKCAYEAGGQILANLVLT